MSRQAKWQRERRASDQCRICGAPTAAYVTSTGVAKQYAYCTTHRAQSRQRYLKLKLEKEKENK